MADVNVDVPVGTSASSKVRSFFTAKSLAFVENEWFFLSVSGVAVILWVVSASVALSAGTAVTELTASCGVGSDSSDDGTAPKESDEQSAGSAFLGIGVVFLIFWLFCAVTFLMRKTK